MRIGARQRQKPSPLSTVWQGAGVREGPADQNTTIRRAAPGQHKWKRCCAREILPELDGFEELLNHVENNFQGHRH